MTALLRSPPCPAGTLTALPFLQSFANAYGLVLWVEARAEQPLVEAIARTIAMRCSGAGKASRCSRNSARSSGPHSVSLTRVKPSAP